MARHRDVGMIAAWHQYRVAFVHYADKFWLLRVSINELRAKCRCRHIVIDIKFFKHFGVFVGRPTRSRARFRPGHARQKASGLHVFAGQNIDIAAARRPGGGEFQRAVLRNIRITNNLERIMAFHPGPALLGMQLIRANRVY